MIPTMRFVALITLMLAIISLVTLLPIGPLSVQGAAQGIVCTVQTSTNCPTNPLGVSTLAGATSVVVNVAVQNSPSLAGFEIIVKTNNSIISPTTVSVTGSVVPGPSILGECINNSGNACGTLDGPGIVHLAVLGSGSTTAPTTGLLFSITYSITVNTPSTGAPIVFQTGCSISSNGNSCVNIETITGATVPENLETATFIGATATYLLGANPASLNMNVTSHKSSVINGTRFGALGAVTINLAVTVSNATVTNRPTASLSALSFAFTNNIGTRTVTLTVTTVAGTPAGSYVVSVSGTLAGQPTRFANVTITVLPPDFSIGASPSSVSGLNAGTTGSSTVTLAGVNNFTGTVSLTLSASTGLTASLTRSSLLVKPGGLNSTTLSFHATAAGTYNVNVTGTCSSGGECTSPAQTHQTTVTVNIADFTMTPSPSSINVKQGSSNVSKITLTSVNGFAGNVTLSVASIPTGLTYSFDCLLGCSSPTTTGPTVAVQGNGAANLTITASTSITPGPYNIVVTGANGTLNHSVLLSATVTQSALPNFDISATSPAAVNATQTAISTITVTAANGFAGTVLLSDTPLPSGLTCTAISPSSVTLPPSPATATLSCSSTTAGTFIVTITATSGSLVHTATATFNFMDFIITATSPTAVTVGSTAISTITVSADNGFVGTVSLSPTSATGLTCSPISPASINLPPSPGTASLSCSASTTGAFNATITGTAGTLTHTATATFNFTDFKIQATSPPEVNATSTAQSTIMVTAINGFSGTVALSDTPLPTGLTCTAISPGSATLPPSPATATLSCSASVAGNFTVTVTGAIGLLTHSATATFSFADFTVTAASPPVVGIGSPATSTISLTAQNHFAGTVALSDNPLPSGLTCNAINPTSITLPPSPATASLQCTSSTAGSFMVTITAASNSLTHTATATFTFGSDFQITATSPAAVNATQTAISTITVTAANGFAGTVLLSDTPLPSGLTCTAISPSSVTLPPSPATATLSCSASVGGIFTVTVKGTSGSLTHNATATFTFTDFTIAATSPASVPTGSSAVSTITVAAVNSFAGTVSLSDTPLPAGLTCLAFSPSSSVSLPPSPATASLSCSSSTAGSFTVSINGTSGSLSRIATAMFTFGADFTITASSPTAMTVGSSAVSTITVTAVSGLMGTVNLSDAPLPAGLTCLVVSPESLTLPPSPATATLSCSSTSANNYMVTITGSSGSLTRTATATFTFTDFTITASQPSTVTISQTATSTITVIGLNGLTGTITASDNPGGLTCSVSNVTLPPSPTTTSLTCSSATAQTVTVTVTGTIGSLSHSTTAKFTFTDFLVIATDAPPALAGVSSTSTIVLSPLNGFTGSVSLSAMPPTDLTCQAITPNPLSLPSSTTATLNCTSTAAKIFAVTITATIGTLTHTASATFSFNDFSITATTPSVVTVGSSVNSTITVSGLNSFSGTIALIANPSTGLTASPIPATLTLTSSTVSATSALALSAGAAGTYTFSVTGTSGPLSHTTILVTLNVEDFAVNLNPNTSTFTVPQGSTITSTVQLTNLGQVSATIHLSAPVVPTGPSTTLSQTSISLSPALGTGSSSLTINIGSAAPGTYTVVINATIGPLIHTQTIIITVIQPVVKFVSVTTPPSSVAVGQEVDVRVDLLNAATIGLSFNVTMDVNSVTVSMQQVSLAPGQDSGTIALKWDTTSYSTGDYSIKIRLVDAIATGPTPASVDLAAENTPSQATVTLTSTQGSPFLPGNTGLIVAVAAVLILVAALATVLFIRRRKSVEKA